MNGCAYDLYSTGSGVVFSFWTGIKVFTSSPVENAPQKAGVVVSCMSPLHVPARLRCFEVEKNSYVAHHVPFGYHLTRTDKNGWKQWTINWFLVRIIWPWLDKKKEWWRKEQTCKRHSTYWEACLTTARVPSSSFGLSIRRPEFVLHI